MDLLKPIGAKSCFTKMQNPKEKKGEKSINKGEHGARKRKGESEGEKYPRKK